MSCARNSGKSSGSAQRYGSFCCLPAAKKRYRSTFAAGGRFIAEFADKPAQTTLYQGLVLRRHTLPESFWGLSQCVRDAEDMVEGHG